MRSIVSSAVLCGFQFLCEPLLAEEENSHIVEAPPKLYLVHDSGTSQIIEIDFIGLDTTKREVLIDLLPRSLPGHFSEDEIAEFSRRIKNLGIFDTVTVVRGDRRLVIELSRKRTLSPIVDFSTGKTIKDASGTLGVSEYDFLGQGTRLGGKVSYTERSLNFGTWIEEHAYSPNRWATEYEAYRMSSAFRFDDTDNEYTRNRLGGFAEWISPFHYGSHILYEFQLVSYYEDFSDETGTSEQENALFVGGLFEIIYDRYKWDDLHPAGYKLVVELRPGTMVDGRFRGETRFKALGALKLTDQVTFVLNGQVAAVNSGDVNHSLLIGSQQGVRGLSDSFYRTSALSYLNSEVRFSVRVANKYYLQPVVYMDMGSFEPMNSVGDRLPWVEALSTGVGMRIVPTRLTNLLLRVDAARLQAPNEEWLIQLGINQYF